MAGQAGGSGDALDPIERAEAHCAAAGLDSNRVALEGGHPLGDYLEVQLPSARRRRSVAVKRSDLERLIALDLKRYILLGDYSAFVDRSDGVIEARVGWLSPARGFRVDLSRLPGAEVITEGSGENDDDEEIEDAPLRRHRRPELWRLAASRGDAHVEISPPSDAGDVLLARGLSYATLKISGIPTNSHDGALEVLERVGQAFLFELDLRYEASVGLHSVPRPIARMPSSSTDRPPQFPGNAYTAEPLALYRYGRAARGLPLLEFLAYYQTLEFFFPTFTREEMIGRVRTVLRDPRFDSSDDVAIGRLLNLASSVDRSRGAEREQLRATIRACTDVDQLAELVTASSEIEEHFCAKHQAIRGVQRLQLAGSTDLRDQVSDRIYAIRCRVVHTKQDGGDSAVDLLLPSSPEARALTPDVELLRRIAQQTLIRGATPMRLHGAASSV